MTTTEIASTSAPHTATTAATATKSTALTAKVYFTRGTTLAVETVPVTAQQPLHDSLQALLSGPRQPGLYTQIPSGTKLLGVSVAQDVATINLSHPAATVQGSPAIPLMLAQIVDTATQFPSVHRVRLLIEGKPVTSLGGEGVPVPRYLDRTNVERMLQQE
ncbi:MAG: GerMN domain-containing protein [Chloroflexi bacterium]|nr:GerMN domain-containing protein [Chloroflexota bacterium]